MNKEIEKAMNRKESKTFHFYGWWIENGYKVMRVVLFPMWVYMCGKRKINNYLNSKCKWDEERANKILSYYVPRYSKWNAENKSFYLADNGLGWDKKKIKMKDRRWWKNNTRGWGGEVRTYLIEKFEMEGFEKIVGDTYDKWTEVTFKLIEK